MDSESDGIQYFFSKSVGYLKSDHVRFKIFVSVQLYCYFCVWVQFVVLDTYLGM